MGWIPFERKGDYDDDEYYFRWHRIRRLCVALLVLIVFVVVVLGLAILITYLVLRPHATHYEVVTATVPTLDVEGASDSLTAASTVNAEFVYGVRARNPNGRVSMEYEKMNVQTTFLGVDIGHSSIGGFRVGHRSAYVASVTTFARGVLVNNIVGNALRGSISQGYVTVRVRIDTRARAHVGSYTSFWMWLHSVCDVTVSPPTGGVAGTLVGSRCHNT